MNLITVLHDFTNGTRDQQIELLRNMVNEVNDSRRRLAHCESFEDSPRSLPFYVPTENNVIRVYGNYVQTDKVMTEMYRGAGGDWENHIRESLFHGISKEMMKYMDMDKSENEYGKEYSVEIAVMLRKDYTNMVREVQRLMTHYEVPRGLKEQVFKILSGELDE